MSRFKRSIPAAQIDSLLSALCEGIVSAADPDALPGVTPDLGDHYLVDLAQAADAECIVSNAHVIELSNSRPRFLMLREFLTSLG